MKNRRVVLASLVKGVPKDSDFRLEEVEIDDPAEGQLLIRNRFASVDPGLRGRLSGERSYVDPCAIGEVIGGATVGQVVRSRHPKYAEGDWIAGALGWQEFGLSDGKGIRRIEEQRLPYSVHIGVLGVPGLTAYFGLLNVGALREGDTVLVSSAAGAVGSAAGQIAKIKGARLIGIAGGPEKCRWLVEELGFDAAIDRYAEPDLASAIAKACPDGVDVLFDNAGNAVIDATLPQMRQGGRIVCSGQTADYNLAASERTGLKNTRFFITNRLRMEGFIAFDFASGFRKAWSELTEWIIDGRLRYREDIEHGIEKLPTAFAGLFKGQNFGRKLVELTGR